MTKHRMFGAPNLSQSKNFFTQPVVVMVETFRRSDMKGTSIKRSG